MSSQSSHHPQEVLLAQFSLYVHKGGLKADSFQFESLLANPENPPSCIDVQVATDDYIKYSEELEVCQGKITDTTAGSSLAGEVEEAFGFLQIYNPVYVRALQFLEAKTASSLPIARVPSPGDSLLKSSLKSNKKFHWRDYRSWNCLSLPATSSPGPTFGVCLRRTSTTATIRKFLNFHT